MYLLVYKTMEHIPKDINGLCLVQNNRIETFFINAPLRVYSYNRLVNKIVKNGKEPPLEVGYYNAILAFIEYRWYLDLGFNMYVLYDEASTIWNDCPETKLKILTGRVHTSSV